MSATGRRLSEAEKPVEEDDVPERRGSASVGWGIKSTRRRPSKEIEKKDDEDDNNKSSDEGQTVISDAESGHGDGRQAQSKKSHQKHHKRKQKGSESTTQFLSSILNHESEDIENSEFVNFKDLPKLPKVESDVKGRFVGSSHKFERPISGFRIRVRLLKYPSFSERAKWPGDLLVLEDRTFSWQEKIFSKSEAEKYSDKKYQQYYNEIKESPRNVGTNLHSYIDSDYFVIRQEEKTVVRRCPASHLKAQRKFTATSAEFKSINSEGETVYDSRDSDSDENRRGKGQSSSQKGRSLKKQTEQEERKHAEKQKKDEEKRKKEVEELETKRQKEEENEIKEALKKSKRQLETEQKQSKLEEKIRKDQEMRDDTLRKYLGTKRPSVAISAKMLTTQSPLNRRPKRNPNKSRAKKRYETKDGEAGSRKGSQSPDEEDGRRSEDSLESDEKTAKKSRDYRKLKSGKSDDHVLTDNGEYEELTRPSDSTRKEDPDSKPVIRLSTRPIWRVAHRRFLERSGLEPPQSMYIMATIPHMNKRNREICVCAIKAYPKSGIVVLKPPFGYRIIEAKRNHVYRLSWELYSPYPSSDSSKTQDARKFVEKTFSKVNQRYQASVQREGTFDDMGVLFEIVQMNEMRLFVMGEIVSATGFEAEPLCVHYLVEMPKGWKNDSVASNLQGITQNSFTTDDGTAHFSHDFFFQLAFSMDSVDQEDTYLRPMILMMVVALGSSGRVRYEGYAYINIPSTPGSHILKVQTWKPKPRSTVEKMQSVFLDVSPSLQDIHAVHIPVLEHEECRRANRLGLQTEPSGFVKVRLNVIHQVPTSYRDQASKLDLLEKMSSATILKSVQAVIEAFQRARKRAVNVKNNSSSIKPNNVL